MMTMPEKLHFIANALEHGQGIEYNDGDGWWPKFTEKMDSLNIDVYKHSEYRIAPVKPRTAKVSFYSTYIDGRTKDYVPFDAVELTDEVRAALEAAGVAYE